MRENINVPEEQAEKVSYGKFKDADALFNAYNNLEAEFTKKCQRIKELETSGNTVNEDGQDKPQYMRDDWQDKVTAFMSENPDAQQYASEMAKVITEDESIAKSNDCLSLAYTKVLKGALKSPAELMRDQKFLDEFVYTNKEVRNKIVSDYIKNLNPQAPDVLGNGGELFVAPPKRPSTLQEAGAMAEKLLK